MEPSSSTKCYTPPKSLPEAKVENSENTTKTGMEKGAGFRRPFHRIPVLVLSDDRAFANRGFADGGAASCAQESKHSDRSEQTLLHWDSPLSRVSTRKLKALARPH